MIDGRITLRQKGHCGNRISEKKAHPTHAQRRWLNRGLDQAGGKLPLFDEEGAKVSSRTILSCVQHGWAEPWFENPVKPDWLVCRLTDAGRGIAQKTQKGLR